jgi:hypothetical protein
MSELMQRLLDKNFLWEVTVATVLMILTRFFTAKSFVEHFASSPQMMLVLTYFIDFLFVVVMLVSVYFIEKKEIRRALFVPFTILTLIVTVYYAMGWFSVYAEYSKSASMATLARSTPFYIVRALFNVESVAILIASMQVAKVVKERKAVPFYAILLVQYVFIVLNLFVVGTFIVKIKNPSAFAITFYQFLEYTAVYFLLAYSPYFVSKAGSFWRLVGRSISYALKRWVLTLSVTALFVFFVLFVPAFIYNMGNTAATFGVYSTARALMYLFTFLIFYLPAAFFIFTSVKAKEDGK